MKKKKRLIIKVPYNLIKSKISFKGVASPVAASRWITSGQVVPFYRADGIIRVSSL
jgi:hypothetical protein